MNVVFKIFLSLSFSGGLLILALFLGKRFWKGKLSRQWQYYVWMIVVLRLLLPFGPETNLMGKVYRGVDEIFSKMAALAEGGDGIPSVAGDSEFMGGSALMDGSGAMGGSAFADRSVAADASGSTGGSASADQSIAADVSAPALQSGKNLGEASPALPRPLLNTISYAIRHLGLIWLAVAAIMLIRKITIYQSFVRYLNAGCVFVSNLNMLDTLSTVAEGIGIKKPVELCVNPLISSPLLIGFFHPRIVLPDAALSEKDFSYIALHELMHYKRRDMFFKWLVQIAVCLHWFNPLVHRMAGEIARACEFSCDEAVLAETGCDGALDYGKTLLDAMAAIRKNREHYQGNFGVISFNENKQLLKERLGAIMHFQKKSKATRIVTALLTFCILFSAVFIGVYPVAVAASAKPEAIARADCFTQGNKPADDTEDEMGLADWVCEFMQWLGYWDWTDEDWVNENWDWDDEDCDWMDEDQDDEDWDRTDEDWKDEDWDWADEDWDDEDWDFDWDDEDEEWQDQALMEAYAAHGITTDGDSCDYPYYYQGKLVNVLLDQQPDSSFYRLSINPEGSVNIRILRNVKGEITGVAHMTKEEVDEILGRGRAAGIADMATEKID